MGPGKNQSIRRPQGLEQLRDHNKMLSSWLVRQTGPLGAGGTRVLWSRSILSHRVMLTPERKVMEKSGKYLGTGRRRGAVPRKAWGSLGEGESSLSCGKYPNPHHHRVFTPKLQAPSQTRFLSQRARQDNQQRRMCVPWNVLKSARRSKEDTGPQGPLRAQPSPLQDHF